MKIYKTSTLAVFETSSAAVIVVVLKQRIGLAAIQSKFPERICKFAQPEREKSIDRIAKKRGCLWNIEKMKGVRFF